ncbi:MAG: HAD family hydrolase [Treponema sp.]|jgi:phosphoglycolate phosphatase|nr:HAD family hydrolase [Treponema sp.]
MRFRAVIFDMDGTLADTAADLVGNINRALGERGLGPVPAERIMELQGSPMETMIALGIRPGESPENGGGSSGTGEAGPGLLKELAARTRELYAEVKPVSRPYPGISELLDELKQKKLKLAVLSNKPHEVTLIETEHLFPRRPFDVLSGIREGFPFKPDPQAVWDILLELDVSPRETILAGDSATDIKTALASGCYALGVRWGYWDVSFLEAAGARRIIGEPRELLELV